MKVKVLGFFVLVIFFPTIVLSGVDSCLECNILMNGSCLAEKYLPFDQTFTKDVKEWSAVGGIWFAEDNAIGVKFKFDDQAIETLSQSGFGFEIEIVQNSGEKLEWLGWSALLPKYSRPVQDTNALDWGSDPVFGILVRETKYFEAGVWYYAWFVFESIPEEGVLIQPNFVIDIDSDCALHEDICSDAHPETCQYFGMETDHYAKFVTKPSGNDATCWSNKMSSNGCCPVLLNNDEFTYVDSVTSPSEGEEISEGDKVYVLGPGSQTTPTDSFNPGLPDFILDKLELTDTSEHERYVFNNIDTMRMHSYSKNIGDADWAGDRDDIYVKFYLSDGYNEDFHSDWDCVGTEQIQQGNLDVGDTKHEWDTFNLSGLDPGVYNIVACVDRKYDQNNGDGEVPEIHKSNNCSTEAVFVVKEPNLRISNFSIGGETVFIPGKPINLSATTINDGADVNSDIKLEWYVSEGSVYNNPTLIQQDNMQKKNLKDGETKLEETVLIAPQVLGTYTLSVHTDSGNNLVEPNETDNWQHIVIKVDDFSWIIPLMDYIMN